MSDQPVIRVRTRVRPPLECAESIDGTAQETDLGTQANNTSTEGTTKTSVAANKAKAVGDYEVGYRRPPVKNQYTPGTSGNLGGRPKGSKNAEKIVQEVSFRSTSVTVNGKKIKMPAFQIALEQVVKQAMMGNLKAIAMMMALNKPYQSDSAPAAAGTSSTSAAIPLVELTESEREALAYVERAALKSEGLADDLIDRILAQRGLIGPKENDDVD